MLVVSITKFSIVIGCLHAPICHVIGVGAQLQVSNYSFLKLDTPAIRTSITRALMASILKFPIVLKTD